MSTGSFIAVEGPIGAGKTTLSTMLSQELNISLLKEIVEENPFLGKFYDNIEEWSFQLEMFFLCNRYKQLEDTTTKYIQHGQQVISDYHIYKNLIFAQRTLSGVKWEKYRQIYHILTGDLPKPDLIIYIRADLQTLLKRIKMRGRSFEQNMDTAYLEQLIIDYDHAMASLAESEPDTKIITIDGNQIDFVTHREQFDLIVSEVKEYIQ